MSGAPNAPDTRNRYEGDPLLGTALNGKFHVHSVLANGGMGRIYRGEQLPLGRPVAIKVLHSKYTSSQEDPAFQKRFFLEASILSKLQHPNIVTVFDYGRIENLEDESYFLAMEFLQGETLHRRLRSLGALPPVEAIGLIRQIARGLREAHRQGVVHRDLKPSNIMLVPEEDGHELVKIIDFGLVKVLADDSEELTKEGSFLGSPRYMSPEQIAHGKVDHRTDIYSLGVILYQCLCGRTPFESENSVHTLMAHLQLPVPPMHERNPAVDVPEVLETFVRRCLEKDSALRPTSMEDFLRGLRECEVALGLATGSATQTGGSGQFGAAPNVPATFGGHPQYPDLPSHHGSGPSGTADTLMASASTLPPARPLAPATADTPQKRAVPPIALAAVALLACVAIAVVLLRPKPVSTPTAPQTVSAPTTPTAPAPPRDYRLVIDSEPPGAQVFERGSLLGVTALALVVDNNAVRTVPRRLEVRLEGYAPFTVDATPSDEAEKHVVAHLVAQPGQSPPPPTRPGVRPGVRPVTRPTRPPPHEHTNTDPDDIRTHR